VSECGGSYDVTVVYGWYSDASVLLEDPGVYVRPAAFIRCFTVRRR